MTKVEKNKYQDGIIILYNFRRLSISLSQITQVGDFIFENYRKYLKL